MISFIAFATLQGSLTLPAFFSDHMVVQRGKPTTVWGIDKPGTKVIVQLNGKSAVVTADSNGKFSAALAKAGMPKNNGLNTAWEKDRFLDYCKDWQEKNI